MRREDITAQIHQQAGISNEEAGRLLDWILEFLKTTLHAGEPVNISGFGKFTVRHKQARLGRNPRTGEPKTISARRVVTFHASHLLKREMNFPCSEEVSTDAIAVTDGGRRAVSQADRFIR